MVAPPIIVSRIWCYSASHSDVGRTHRAEYGFALIHQVGCSIVGVRRPVESQSADRVTVRVRVVRIKVDIVHEGRQIWGERSDCYCLFRWEVLVLLRSFEQAAHSPIRVRRIGRSYASRERNVAGSSSKVTASPE